MIKLVYVSAFFSGAASLIYQIVWQKYLVILLGAHAKATAFILAIFLGGLSLGYYLFGQFSRWRPQSLISCFAALEAGLGLWALLFPLLFRFFFTHNLPPVAGLSDLFVGILLLLPPTILMGGTLPLITHAIGANDSDPSRVHAKVYGWNTLGAAVGSLLAGYILLPRLGLVNALGMGAMLNFLVGCFAYLYWRPQARAMMTPELKSSPVSMSKITPSQVLILSISFLSGFVLLALENILVRYLNLSIGSAHYNFTLVVFLFVMGLGVGSLTLKPKANEPMQIVRNLLLSGFGFLAIYWTISYWPYWHHLIRISFQASEGDYQRYQLSLFLGFGLLLLAPLIIAGRTLPLCFHLLRDSSELTGFRVGQLYSINTLGCVLGALVGGYWLLNFVDLDILFKILLALVAVELVLGLLFARLSAPLFFWVKSPLVFFSMGFPLIAFFLLESHLGIFSNQPIL